MHDNQNNTKKNSNKKLQPKLIIDHVDNLEITTKNLQPKIYNQELPF